MKKRSPDPTSTGTLREIQQTFAQAVMRPLGAEQNMQPVWFDGRPTLTAVFPLIKPNDRLNSLKRLEIYNRQYWFRLIDSLREDFPALRTVLGEDRFERLTIAYLEKFPSRSYTLRDLGSRLETLLRQEPAWASPHAKVARDVARLEWAHIVAFDSEALPPLEMDELLGSDPATLRIGLQPYFTLLACDYAVDDFVLSMRKQDPLHTDASNAVSGSHRSQISKSAAHPKAEKIWLAVHRLENAVYYKRLSRDAHRLLTSLRNGLTLHAACEHAFRGQVMNDMATGSLQTWFSQWASFGWLCRAPDPRKTSENTL